MAASSSRCSAFQVAAIVPDPESALNDYEGQPMASHKGSSKTVSTEALMTVFHPQDLENLDAKMVSRKSSSL